jgi:hypothetical protein
MKQSLIVLALLTASLTTVTAQTQNGCFATKNRASVANLSFLCTQTYQVTGPCDGLDAVDRLKIIGTPTQSDWRIKVWEPVPIIIRGVEVAQLSGSPVEWAMVGHNSWPDIILMLSKGMTYNRVALPDGTGMPLPGKLTATEEDYLDFHIVCKGDAFAFWSKIEYTAQPP